jgi:hypothetical protein
MVDPSAISAPSASPATNAAAAEAPLSREAVQAAQHGLRLQGARADPLAVVQAHIAAVHTRDPALMAADYSDGARITRGADSEIPAQYFPRAVLRLGTSRLLVHELLCSTPANGPAGCSIVTMQWQLQGGPGNGTRGTDTFTIRGDRIVHQQVLLHTPDY